MDKFSKGVVRYRKLILILCILLLIPSVYGIKSTRINYDMLTYLPEKLDTVRGQDILMDDYGKGAFSIIILDGKSTEEAAEIASKIEKIDSVDSVISYDRILSTDVPEEIIPDSVYEQFNEGEKTLMAVFFDSTTSSDETLEAIGNIRKAAGDNTYVTGMSALVRDLRDLCEKEEPHYVGLAVICAVVAMMVLLDSWVIPVIFLVSIGMAIIYNMGTNIFFGEISYITKALSAVLQLAVTMDYSIFLWHSYEEEKELQKDRELAMASAIRHTFASVIGSSVTTIAGFIALCFMSFTMGRDLGIVMAKGVAFGVIGCVTTLPALILEFEKLIDRTRHKTIIPDMGRLSKWVVKKSTVFIVIFAVILIPAVYGYMNTGIYYDMAGALPEHMDYVISEGKLRDEFNMGSAHMILTDKDTGKAESQAMNSEIEKIDGVRGVMSLNSVLGNQIPEEILPDDTKSVFKSGDYQLSLVLSEYRPASKEMNRQITKINNAVKDKDPEGMIIGEAACTKDLMKTTDRDFKIVSGVSVILIFLIIAFVLKSASLPALLVLTIYFAIFINLGIPFYTGTKLAFIAPICLSTIQLGATVDYAILMTTRYKRERLSGMGRDEAVSTALQYSIPSVIVSALGFFAATFGVSLYSELDLISSMCGLMARGAIVSCLAVIFIMPAFLKITDRLTMRKMYRNKAGEEN